MEVRFLSGLGALVESGPRRLDVGQVVVEPAQVVVLFVVRSWEDAAARQLRQILERERQKEKILRRRRYLKSCEAPITCTELCFY